MKKQPAAKQPTVSPEMVYMIMTLVKDDTKKQQSSTSQYQSTNPVSSTYLFISGSQEHDSTRPWGHSKIPKLSIFRGEDTFNKSEVSYDLWK